MLNEVNTKKLPLPQLPEGCIAKIISFTSPKDACRAAAVSLGFRSAADSDDVWEHFLPPNYSEIVSRASSPLPFSSKKHLYFLLHDGCTMLFLDGGKMVAELRSIKRLEIRGVMPARMLSPNTKYAAWLIFSPSYDFSGLDCPSKAVIKFAKEDGTELVGEHLKIYIECPRDIMSAVDGRKSWSLANDWEGIELGEFFVGEGADYDVHIQVSETEYLNLKKGLIIEGIELMPSHRPAASSLSVLRDWS